ncbi:MAG: cytochrome C oxidase subunit IV family protein [Myxococcota bacterium]|nr:cytochrome C oxidase subunit IV family protein [Myxococcota bacterium]
MSAHEHHIMPLKTYFAVYGSLLVLTVVTVAVSQLGLPPVLSIVAAMAVALVKATLVATWFMHLKYDRKFNIFMFGASFWFMAVFFIFTMVDLSSRDRVLGVTGNFEQRMDAAIAQMATEEEQANLSGAELGAALYTSKGCAGCHSLDGSKLVGPTFQGLYGKTENLEDGSTVEVNEEYLKESILEPMAKIVKDYPPSMVVAGVTEEDADALIEYIKTVK